MIFGPDYIIALLGLFASIAGGILIITGIIGFFCLIGVVLSLIWRDDA